MWGSTLVDDTDMLGYFLLAGRAGNQIAYGGTVASEDLYLRSTANATKGTVYIADDGGDVSLGGASSVVYATTMPAGEDNSVVILDADGSLRTDEIDSRVWGTSLVDVSGAPETGYYARFTGAGAHTVEGRTAAQVLSDIGAQAALTNPVTGTGTAGYIPKFSDVTTLANSVIYETGGNVGLSTTPTTLHSDMSCFRSIAVEGWMLQT